MAYQIVWTAEADNDFHSIFHRWVAQHKWLTYLIKKNYICSMTHTSTPNHKIHQGRNVKRFREILGIKQEGLALELGDDRNQRRVSLLEQKETIEPCPAATDLRCPENTGGGYSEF